jgi:hypothetical protein
MVANNAYYSAVLKRSEYRMLEEVKVEQVIFSSFLL